MEKIESERLKSTKTIDGLTVWIPFLMFTGTVLYGIFNLFNVSYSSTQATLIIIEGAVGIFFSIFPLILDKSAGIRLSSAIRLIIITFMLLAVIIGEVFEFYYRVSWWDIMLHIYSGFGIAFVAFCIVNLNIRDTGVKNKFMFCIIGAVLFSLAAALMWEVAEFAIDSAFGTNMQKFIPENYLFNGGKSTFPLSGTTEEIAEFFRSPMGYRYALMDTMGDILACLLGVSLCVITCIIINKLNEKVFDYSVTKRMTETETSSEECGEVFADEVFADEVFADEVFADEKL